MSVEGPEGWEVVCLADCLDDFRNGWTYDARGPDGSLPVTRIETIANGVINYERVGLALPDDRIQPFRMRRDDILFSHINSVEHIAKVAIKRDDKLLYHGMNLMRLRASDRIVPEFLFARLQSRETRNHFRATCKRAVNQASLNKGEIGSYQFLLPPLDEQRRIAEVLRSVELAIEAGSAVLSQTREARAHQLERLMALPGEMRPLTDVCRLGGGYGFPIKHQGKQDGVYPFAKVSDMNRPGNETELKTAENYVDDADLKVLRAKPFPAGTTFFPKVGATLLTNKRRIAVRQTIVDNNVMAAVPSDIDAWFLFYALCTIDMGDYVQPGAIPSVNQGTLGTIMIPVPSPEIQERFVRTMRDLDRTIEAQRAAIASLIDTKAAASTSLLSGGVRVPA
jgi:type I restriction enzyme S subunit